MVETITQSRKQGGARSVDASAVGLKPVRPVLGWAAVGLLFNVLAAYVVGRFLLDGPTPTHRGPTEASDLLWAGVVFWQVFSLVAMLVAGYVWLVRPWRRERRITTDGLFVLVFALLYWQDPLSNWAAAQWTLNAMYVNLGSWGQYFPGFIAPNQHLTPEPILSEGPVYVWGVFGAIVFSNYLMRRAKARWPNIGHAKLIAICYFFFVALDSIAEPLVMALFGGWTYAGSIKGLTLFEGRYFQFPIYQGFHWGVTWTAMALVRFYMNDRGETIVERGIAQVRASAKGKTFLRFLALSGVMNVLYLFTYNLPMGYWALNQSTWPTEIQERSYYTYGVCGPGTDYACSGPGVPIPKANKSLSVGPAGQLNSNNVAPAVTPPADRADEGLLTPILLDPD